MGFNNDRSGFGCSTSAKTYTVVDYPLTLPDIKKLKTLSILGNSAQNGTPSPDNPIEVVGTGVRTGNLFDAEKFKELCLKNVAGTIIDSIDGRECIVGNSSKFHDNWTGDKYSGLLDNIDNDTQYTISIAVKALSEDNTGISIGFIYTDGTRKAKLYSKISNTYFEALTLTSDSGKIIKTISFSYDMGCKIAVDISAFLVEGEYTADTMPPYEPYGYKVAVQAQGRNLLDYTKAEPRVSGQIVDIIDNGVKWSGDYYFLIPCKLKAGKTYSLSCKGESNIAWNFKYIDGTSGLAPQLNNKALEALKDVSYIAIYKNNPSVFENDIIITDIGLYEGTYTAETMPSYEPYKEPQSFNVYTHDVLHGVGDAHDTVVLDFDKRKAELVQQYEYFKVDADNWGGETGNSYNGISTTNRYLIMNLYSGNYPANDSKCNILQKYNGAIWVSDVQGFTWNSSQLHLRINNDVLGIAADDTAEERTSKFVEYIQSNDIYVLGKLISPVVSDITALQDWDTLPQLRGTWILTAAGGTEPTLKATYTSNTDPYTDYSNIVSVLPVYPDLDITEDDPTTEGVNMEETEDQPETTSTDEPTSETNNSIDTIDILDLYE